MVSMGYSWGAIPGETRAIDSVTPAGAVTSDFDEAGVDRIIHALGKRRNVAVLSGATFRVVLTAVLTLDRPCIA